MSTEVEIIREPSVRLVGRLAVDEAELAGFLEDEGVQTWTTDAEVAGEKLVEVAGRLCYKSYARPRPGGSAAYLGHILEVGHGSVIEHAVYNFIITGVSRSFTHELVRHRAGFAYSQRSQRFVDENGGAFVVPPALIGEVDAATAYMMSLAQGLDAARTLARRPPASLKAEIGLIWLASVQRDQEDYARISDYLMGRMVGEEADPTARRKRAREAARSLLPNATETQIFVTVNARAARHFIEARGDASADAEIRKVAVAMLRILRAESPNLFGDYAVEAHPAGGEVVSTPHRKV